MMKPPYSIMYMHILYGKFINVALYRVLCTPLKSTWVDIAALCYRYLMEISYVAISIFKVDDYNYINRREYYYKRDWQSFPYTLFIVLCTRQLFSSSGF